jgi:hypothetical protein
MPVPLCPFCGSRLVGFTRAGDYPRPWYHCHPCQIVLPADWTYEFRIQNICTLLSSKLHSKETP